MNRLNDLYEQINPKTTPEELSRRVMDAEIKATAKKRPSKAIAAVLAATVTVSALTVTAGAANGWDYAGMFRSLFGEEKTENIMENIVPEATVLQDTIDTMDFELVAAAADKHGVLAILDIYSENGYKLIGNDEYGNEIIYPFQDLFISFDTEVIGSSGTGVQVLEKSEEKVRLSIRMLTDRPIKNEKITMTAQKQSYVEEGEETCVQVFSGDISWKAEFMAEYTSEEIRYEKDMELFGGAKLTDVEVSPISVYFEGERLDNFFGSYWDADETYVVLDGGEKVRITDISASAYESDSPTGSTMLSMGFEEPVNPEAVCSIYLNGETVEIK